MSAWARDPAAQVRDEEGVLVGPVRHIGLAENGDEDVSQGASVDIVEDLRQTGGHRGRMPAAPQLGAVPIFFLHQGLTHHECRLGACLAALSVA
jgi:hypothetical protein